jgi:hypothetical protein
MKMSKAGSMVGTAVLIALLGCGSAAMAGEAFEKAVPIKKGAAPRFPNGRPDFSGVLFRGGEIRVADLKPGDSIQLLPEAKKLMDSRTADQDPVSNCLPAGVPRVGPLPWRIVQATDEKYIFILFEGNIHSWRQIFMDGRKHPAPEDIDPRWYGHSIGRWEGDTLVVDSVGFNDKFWFGQSGLPHTEKLHIVERFSRPDASTLLWEYTIDDPGAYAKPFTIKSKATYRENTELMEFFCQENETSTSSGNIPAYKANSNLGTNSPVAPQ